MPLLYWARVSGTTSGPTLSCTAILASVLKSPASAVMDGCSAYWRPSGSATVGASSVAASASLAIAMPPEACGTRIWL